jgi:prepilin-type N-terminal cleavage/methylation domain-containing protein
MRSSRKKAFTLSEMMIVLTIFSLVFAMMMAAMTNMGKGVTEPRLMVTGKSKLTRFSHGMYNFLNNSLSAYFIDTDLSELDYMSATIQDRDPRLDILYLQKDNDGATGRIVYSNSERRFEYYKTSSTSTPQIMLEEVYRIDSTWDVDGNLTDGVEPIFKFPHRTFLYNTDNPLRPIFVICQFRKLLVPSTSEKPVPTTIPITLMLQVNVSDYQEASP